MKMTKDYYNDNVDMAVEFEEESGYRYWKTFKGLELKDGIAAEKEYGDIYLSDIDLCTKQSDDKVRAFLNFVDYNWQNNPNFKGLGFYDVLDKAFGVEFH